MKDLAGRTAFVTGAASGIGLGIATALAQAGVKVMLCDIEEAALARAVEGLKLNNAGVSGGGSYGSWTDAGWDWTLGVNLMAFVWGIEIFGPLIEQHGEGGHIVSTASIAGLISNNFTIPYNVSKYGVVALSEGLRGELAQRGIGVSVLCPGFIRTNIMDSVRNLPERFDRPSDDRLAAMRRPTCSNTFRSASRTASIHPMSASSCVKGSKTTGRTFSPTPSSNP